MQASALISIQPFLEQSIEAIYDSFEREKISREIAGAFEKEYERLGNAEICNEGHRDTAAGLKVDTSSYKQFAQNESFRGFVTDRVYDLTQD